MKPRLQSIPVTVIAINLVQCIIAQDFYYVKPHSSLSANCPSQPCLTLGQFTVSVERYFTTGSMFVFLPGNHSIESTLSLGNISDLTLRGVGNSSTASRIFLGSEVSVVFYEADSVHIEGLTFILCKNQCPELSALQFINSSHISISNSSFRGSGKAKVRAISLQHSNISVLNCLFKGNRGFNGGAIGMLSETILTIAGSIFIGNVADNAGGSIAAHGGTVELIGTPRNIFRHNWGQYRGGALDCDNCTVILRGNNIF